MDMHVSRRGFEAYTGIDRAQVDRINIYKRLLGESYSKMNSTTKLALIRNRSWMKTDCFGLFNTSNPTLSAWPNLLRVDS